MFSNLRNRSNGGGGTNYDTQELTPWSWSKLTNFDHLTTVILKFWSWSWSKMTNFDHLTTVILKFWPWSWSKVFDYLTIIPGRWPNGQTLWSSYPPPPQSPIRIQCNVNVICEVEIKIGRNSPAFSPARFITWISEKLAEVVNDTNTQNIAYRSPYKTLSVHLLSTH